VFLEAHACACARARTRMARYDDKRWIDRVARHPQPHVRCCACGRRKITPHFHIYGSAVGPFTRKNSPHSRKHRSLARIVNILGSGGLHGCVGGSCLMGWGRAPGHGWAVRLGGAASRVAFRVCDKLRQCVGMCRRTTAIEHCNATLEEFIPQ
jgi:hypothetical protein